MNLETEKRTLVTKELENTQERGVIVFDMDGTLYQLDGESNGFSGSSLEELVLRNAKQFVLDREGCSGPEADLVIESGLKDVIGLSNFLSQRYGITREEYFNTVWDINPEGIITNYEDAVGVVRKLAASNQRLVLLTSAPKAWQARVFEFLELGDCFSVIYTGEDFGQKDEVFEKLSQAYDSTDILSVGDQIATDIEPARRLGMETLLVTNPRDLKMLVERERRIYE